MMRSNSGKDEGRNNMRDPTMRSRTEQRSRKSDRLRPSHAKASADHRGPQGLGLNPVEGGNPVERKR